MAKEKYTVKEMAEALRASGGFVTRAAKKLGCGYKTVIKYIAKYPELEEERTAIREGFKDVAEDIIVKHLKRVKKKMRDGIHVQIKKKKVKKEYVPNQKDLDVAFKFLSYQAKDRGYVTRNEHTGEGGKPLKFANVNLSDFSDKELKLMMSAGLKLTEQEVGEGSLH